MSNSQTGRRMRVWHRYLGFFLTGIMAVYALSGVVLIFRDTDFLKHKQQISKELEPGLTQEALGRALRIKKLKVTNPSADLQIFEQGTYNRLTGEAVYTTKKLPFLLDKMTHMHKANSKHPLFWLNIFFGVSLLFFVVSSFWMFRPKTSIFRRGLYFTAGGILLTVLMLYV